MEDGVGSRRELGSGGLPGGEGSSGHLVEQLRSSRDGEAKKDLRGRCVQNDRSTWHFLGRLSCLGRHWALIGVAGARS